MGVIESVNGRKVHELLRDNPLGLPTGRIRRSDTPVPRLWHPIDKNILSECSVLVNSRIKSNLRLKVLVFANPKHLRTFWRKSLGRADLGPDCQAAVSRLSYDVESYRIQSSAKVTRYTQVDPLFYAVMGLQKQDLTHEIIAHECLHAASAYLARTYRRGRAFSLEDDRVEEELAYPLGALVRDITRWLVDLGYTIRHD